MADGEARAPDVMLEVEPIPNFKVPLLTVVFPGYVFAAEKTTALLVAPVFAIYKEVLIVPLIIPETVNVPVVAFPEVPI